MNKPILEEAHMLIYGDRENTYGNPAKNLDVIADFWTTYINAREQGKPLDRDDVCYMMSLLKIARLANNPKHHDSRVDSCGYMALADRCDKEV